jgi:AcrR family transcriptional regulator
MLVAMALDGDSTQTSRRRLLDAGKALFARHGYEQTSTATIAREAGTSESQLVRYYGGKAGLLGAIFNESWLALNQRVQTAIAAAADAREALLAVLETMLQAFAADPELAFLFIFEGRRVRANSEIVMSKGFGDFQELLRTVIRRGHRDGTFGDGYNDNALAFALLGASESLLRERLMARRLGQAEPFTDEEMRNVFVALLNGVMARG